MSGRRNIMLGTAGHVDHGKTALVKLLTGCETDTLAEEQQRGLTIDLGFAPCRLSDQRVVGVVDVPGHVDFIRNMVAGAHGIDVVIFVVAADDGIMPQTHEHLHILTLMGLRHGVVALTKIDLVDDARRAAVPPELRRLLAGTFLADAPICPVSSVSGEGFDVFFDTLNAVVHGCQDRPCHGLFRVWVGDGFTIRGAGTIVTGIPTHGTVRPGDVLRLLPAGLEGRVRRMQVYGEDASEGRAGECVALNLPELDHEVVRRGMVLCADDGLNPVVSCEAELRLLAGLGAPIRDGTEVYLHTGTAAVLAHVAMLEKRQLAPGETQLIQLRPVEPITVVAGDRFVLRANLATAGRSGLTTIGGGRMLGASNVRLRRRKPWILARLTARREALDDPARWAEQIIHENAAPLTPGELRRRCRLRPDEATTLIQQLLAEQRLVATPRGSLAHPMAVAERAAQIEAATQAFHAAQPQQAGLTRETLMTTVGGDAELFGLAVDQLLRTGRATFNGVVLAQAGWRPRLSDPDEQMSEQVAAAFQQAGCTAPMPEELADRLRLPLERVTRLTRLLQERGVLVRLDDRVTMHRDAVAAGRQAALTLFRQAASFTTMQFRDALGVSRKFAVPLLDHLDRSRFTVRSGHHRTPGAEARKQLPPRQS
jgi:selenocysteine-specific elongation factor